MKLYIRQKVFSWGDRFTVKDSAGVDRYYVEGEVFTFGKKLHVYDGANTEVAYIEQQLFTWFPRYNVSVGGREAAQVVREFSFMRPRYRVEGPDWRVEGEFLAHEYDIFRGETRIATISKEWMTWGDSYELNVFAPENELLALATVLAIDAAMDQQND